MKGLPRAHQSLLRYPAGWITDRVGKRKWMVVAGYVIASATRPFLAITKAGRCSAWGSSIDSGEGLRSAPRDALIADSAVQTPGV
ncbi:MAG: hypothetical protein IPG76_24075 [Acidobacteria bacterium]|nr:hypothetical protein [Acidobacteriota bacterium]